MNKKPLLPMSIVVKRRHKLLNSIGDALLIIPSASEQTRNRDCMFSFRQDSDFWYLSHFNEPEAVMVLDGKNKTSILFSKPYDKHHTIWEGEITGQESAVTDFLFDESDSIANFKLYIEKACSSVSTVISPYGRYREFDLLLLDTLEKSRQVRRSKVAQNWLHSDQFIHKMRQIKDVFEIDTMRYAAHISAQAHKDAVKKIKQFDHESKIEALFNYHYGCAGGIPAYQNIVASGNNACTLHYTKNNKPIKNNDLVLIDSGCEIEGYASDITRTIPASGKFTPLQKEAYNHVLDALNLAIEKIMPGVTIKALHEIARNRLIGAMLDLKLVKGNINSVLEDKSYTKYFMHGTSHWLGIDVHDVGDYTCEKNNSKKLEENMVITVEPGIYIREDDENAPKELRGIGIRIEDDIVVTKEGYENLTIEAPKSVDDIEILATQ